MSVWLTSVVGIPTPSKAIESGDVETVAAWARTNGLGPRTAVAAWAQAQAVAAGATLLDGGLRLFQGEPMGERCPVSTGAPSDLGHLYETMLAGDVRKRGGVHLTPADVATHLVGLLEPGWERPEVRVLDPSVGGGAFLIAAADSLVAAGIDAQAASSALLGIDHDPVAVEIAEAAVSLWRVGHGLEPGPAAGLSVGDGLLDALPACDVVVGNPPFLNQLRSDSANAGERRNALRARWGEIVTAYTDEAWLFLAAALDALSPGGQLVMVQPVSVLAARHGAAVRHRLVADAELAGLWISDGRVFDASVEVCAPLLRRLDSAKPSQGVPEVRRWRGRSFEPLNPATTAPSADDWGRTGAAITGIPAVRLANQRNEMTVGDMATVTAGFRDQFYGLAPYVREASGEASISQTRPLATVGMLDPFRFRWGSDGFRFAGDRYVAPVLDADALVIDDPELARWVEARHRPKVLLATQTKVIEAWADVAGTVVPATPTISLEPIDADDPTGIWRILALLMTPAISADVAAACFGTALSIRALKVSARDVASLPVPRDRKAWDEGAGLAKSIQAAVDSGTAGDAVDADVLRAFATTMHHAFVGVIDVEKADELDDWWRAGWPRR